MNIDQLIKNDKHSYNMNNKLNIVYTENKRPSERPPFSLRMQKEEIQATMERLWLQCPEQFNPLRECMGRKRISDTFNAIKNMISLTDIKATDLGCGSGVISRKLRDAGAIVDAVDVATQALQRLKSEEMLNITAIQDCLPSTSLKDQTYDLVVCTELIGYLKDINFRILMAELARLVKRDGLVVCSTELDIDTDNALDRFAALAETEFTIEQWLFSYHLLQLRLNRFFETPAYYVRCYEHHEFRQKELDKRTGFSQRWLSWNTQRPLIWLWRGIKVLFNPFVKLFRQNVWVMNTLEKITRFFWSEAGISHAVFLGKRRPLTFPVKQEDLPRELKHKRQVWE